MSIPRLGVNIDHVATLRQARRTVYPDLAETARLCEKAGAHGITIHLREDRRHIQDADVYALRRTIGTRMNLEMANNPGVLAVALDVVPHEICMVPERREELTTEGGLDAAGSFAALEPTLKALKAKGIKISLFIDPEIRQVEAAAALGADYIELHTGTYALEFDVGGTAELDRIVRASEHGAKLGLRVNAGHGLTVRNVVPLLKIPNLDTFNIGHSIVCDAVFCGIEQAVRNMLAAIGGSR